MRKLFSVVTSLAFLANSLLYPFSIVYAEDLTPTPEATIIAEETATTSPESTVEPSVTPEITLTPEPTTTPEATVAPSPEPTTEPSPTQSPSPWTFEKVELNKEYQNGGVTLTFTKLPNPSGNIKIEEITLSEEQIKQTGSLSDKAYDITSDMIDGSFSYNLSLPIPESSKGKSVEVKFAEELSNINSAEKVDNSLTKTDTSVSVTSLNHFTIFVVTAPTQTGVAGACVSVAGATSSVDDKCFNTIQAAINDPATITGSIINVAAGTYNLTSRIDVNKAVSIIGDTTTPANVVINAPTAGGTQHGQNSVFMITSSNVTIKGFRLQGALHTGVAQNAGIYVDDPRLLTNPGLSNITISNNEITNNGYGVIVMNVRSSTVSDNKIYSNKKFVGKESESGIGIVVYGDATGDSATNNLTIDNNDVYDNETEGIRVGVGGETGPDYIAVDLDTTISNNTIYNNGSTISGIDKYIGIKSSGFSNGVTVIGNEIYNHTGVAINTTSGNAGIQIHDSKAWSISNNNIYNNLNGIIFANSGAYGADSGSHTIIGNDITNNVRGISIDKGTEAVANNNNISDNNNAAFSAVPFLPYGAYNSGTVAFDATSNWWGSAVLATVQSKVNDIAKVTVAPYYVDSDMNTLSNAVVSEVYVDDDYKDGNAGGHYFGYDAFSKIQDGITAVSSDGTVNVAAGEYTEQVIINKDLTLQGAGRDNTKILSPAILAETGGTGKLGILAVVSPDSENPITVDISGITVNGNNQPIDQMVGVYFFAANGSLSDSRVTGMRESTLTSGSIERWGVFTNHIWDTLVSTHVTISGNIIDNYQKAGIVASEWGSTMTATGNTVTGAGPTTVIAQNGIESNYGASAIISGNTVSGHNYTPDSDYGAGILVVGNHLTGNPAQPSTSISDNTVYDNEVGVAISRDIKYGYGDALATINDNSITGNTTGVKNDNSSGTLNATENYWGSSSPNFGTIISGSVTFRPYYTDSAKNILSPTAPGIPTTGSTSPTNNTTPTWSWASSIDAHHYLFYWSTILGGETNNSGDVLGTSFQIPVLNPLTESIWYSKVLAYDPDGHSSPFSGNSSPLTIDKTNPYLSSVQISSNNTTTTLAKVGDIVTLHFFSSEPVKPPTIYIAGHQISEADITNNVSGGNGNEWFAHYHMVNEDSEGQISFSIAYFDAVDNAGLTVTNITDGLNVVFDKTAPTYAWSSPTVDSIYSDNQSIYIEASITETGSGIDDGTSCNPAIHVPAGSFTGTVTYSAATGKCTGTITLDDPSWLNDGTHHITLTVADITGNSTVSADRNILIDNTNPSLSSYTLSETIISPNGDGIKDSSSIDVEYSEQVNADINILDSFGVKVRDLYNNSAVTNPDAHIWNGKNNSDVVVADGVYTIQVIGTDSAGNTVTDTSKTITIDNSAPVISLIGVTPNIEVGGTYTELGATTDDGSTVSITGSVITNVVNSYTITYNATDTAGNIATLVTRTVNVIDSIEEAFNVISSTLAGSPNYVANNLNDVTTNNIASFPNLSFEKSVIINGVNTKVGKLKFTAGLDLSSDATKTFLQNLGDYMKANAGSMKFNATTQAGMKTAGAEIKMYGVDVLGYINGITPIIIRDDAGNILSENDTNYPTLSSISYVASDGGTITFSTNHFTQFDLPGEDQTTPDAGGDAILSGDTTEVVLTDPNQDVTVDITSGTVDPTIDVSAFVSLVDGEQTGTLPEITINSDVADVVIPDGTEVTGPADWDGVIQAPISGTPAGGNAPAGFSVGSTVISVGSPDGTLTFDTAVTIVLPGVTGTVGYRPSGSDTWYTITTCGGSYTTPTLPTAPGECAINNGTDTKILTYHFTSFGSLTTNSSGSSGGGGITIAGAPVCNDTKPGSAPSGLTATAGLNSVTLTWNKASDPVSYYLITYGTSSGSQTYGNPNIGGSSTTSYTITNLSGGVKYYFKVRAGNGCAPGDYSNEASVALIGGFVEGIAPGFEAGVLGESTEQNLETTPSPTPGPSPSPSPEIKGVNTTDFNWWIVIVPSLLGLIIFALLLRKNKSSYK